MAPNGITRTVSGSFEYTIRAPAPKTPPRRLPVASQLENLDGQTIEMPDYPLTSPVQAESLPDTIVLDNETPSPEAFVSFPNENIDTATEPHATNTTNNVGKPCLESSH